MIESFVTDPMPTAVRFARNVIRPDTFGSTVLFSGGALSDRDFLKVNRP